MLALSQIPFHDSAELWIVQPAFAQAVQQRRKLRNGDGEQDSARTEHSPGLGECGQPLSALGQMVERPEHQHDIRRRIGGRQCACVADGRRERQAGVGVQVGRPRRCPFDVERHWINEMDPVPLCGQPGGVDAGSATHIQHISWRRWHVPLYQLLGPRPFERPKPHEQPLVFLVAVVVAQDRWIELLGAVRWHHPILLSSARDEDANA